MAKTYKLIPALDCGLDEAVSLVSKVDSLDGVYGYKVGFALGLREGLPGVVRALRARTKKPIIYDHQKAGTDIPDTAELFARTLFDAGVTEGILFPQAGPETLAAWTRALKQKGLKVIVGGVMTHPKYLASEGGFLVDERIFEVYALAAKEGVSAFVVPMTKPEVVRKIVERLGASSGASWEFYSPGLGHQAGDWSAFPFLEHHYAIVGRSLLSAPDPVGFIQGLLAGKEASR
jgi:orotidine-5'-phosphate decarboxylase